MLTHLYQYNGFGKPVARFDIHGLFLADFMKVVVMSPAEEEYLYALQLMHGRELKLVSFQEYHDYGWANPKQNPLDLYLKNVACSHPDLHDLMINPQGDIIWQRELGRQARIRNEPNTTLDINPRKRMFI